MIKLPDFTKCVQIQDLFLNMGIREIKLAPLPEDKFVRTIREVKTITIANTGQVSFREKIKTTAVDVDPTQIKIDSKTGLLEVNGSKCCIYIKNQWQGYDLHHKKSSYRFHLCECRTIHNMISHGKKSRYVATARDDGLFPVNAQGEHPTKEVLLSLELCENCRQELQQKGMYDVPFSLKKFFSKYQSEIKQTFQKEEIVFRKERYSPNHKEIADAYKAQVHYRCQKCGVNCSEDKDCLHLHHKDSDGQNNSPDNLIVLCVLCHASEFNHGHMEGRFSSQKKRVRQLQREQGIINV